MKVLILYDGRETYTNTVFEYLNAFAAYSAHEIYYLDADPKVESAFDFSSFDVLVIHYSVRVAFGQLPHSYAQAVSRFTGVRVLFLQDEYDNTERTRRWIEENSVQLVFTCVPRSRIDSIYPAVRFPGVQFVNVLTAYAPMYSERPVRRALRDRSIVIGYRGRALPYWYGTLGQEKLWIGQRMRKECLRRNIPADIAWRENERIYGGSWNAFLGNCRATLGTESGSNVFDYDGTLRACVENELQERPMASFSSIFNKYLREHEIPGLMNQVSAKVFEAISLGTALVLFEGEYSGVLAPDRHFIPLKKDFSNIDEVFHRLDDIDQLECMADAAYEDIVTSGKYSYPVLVTQFDYWLTKVSEQEKQPQDRSSRLHSSYTRSPIRAKSPVLLPRMTAKEVEVASRHLARRLQFFPLGIDSRLMAPLIRFRSYVDGLIRQESLRRKAKYVLIPVWQRMPESSRKLLRPVIQRLRRFRK